MSRLTRDGTAELVSRDQNLRHARGQGNIIFPVQLTTSRIGNLTRLIHTLLYVMTINTYIRARLCRGKEGLHRAPTFVRQFGGYTHILLLFLSSTHYCPLFHPLLSEISSSSCKDLARGFAGSKTPGVVTICGWSAAGRRPTPGLQQQLQGSCARVRRIQTPGVVTICRWSAAGRRPTPGLQQ